MEKETCRTCQYFIQHYSFAGGKFRWINCGHCTQPKVRRKTPHSKACEYYIYAESVESPFVTKEYLSKELLKYVCSLDLPPKIEACDENT